VDSLVLVSLEHAIFRPLELVLALAVPDYPIHSSDCRPLRLYHNSIPPPIDENLFLLVPILSFPENNLDHVHQHNIRHCCIVSICMSEFLWSFQCLYHSNIDIPDQRHPNIYSSHPRTQNTNYSLPHWQCNTCLDRYRRHIHMICRTARQIMLLLTLYFD